MTGVAGNSLILSLIAFACLAALPVHADLNQAEALAAAAAVAKKGSDESLQNSTTSAMKAMMDLSDQNRPGAIKNGYKSFGEYRTSQDLDSDRMRNRIRQIDLFTSTLAINSSVPAWVRTRENFDTTYTRLDPNFLRHGEAGKVAAEFERRSGMPRETFLKHMAYASESRISGNDPNLDEKVLRKFIKFIDDIPNEEFKARVKKELEETSFQARSTLIRDGVERVAEVLAKYGIDVGVKITGFDLKNFTNPERGPASVTQEAAAPGSSYQAFTGVLPSGSRGEVYQATKGNFVRDIAPRDAEFRGLEREKFTGDALGSVMQTALDEQEQSIFKQVSRRYRAVTQRLN